MLAPDKNWTRYLVDHNYYGIAVLVESYLDFFRRNVYGGFNAIFYGSYNKFLAALEGKISDLNISPTEVKYIATAVTEGQILPALNVDVASIDQDEIASPLYYNFHNISASLEKAVGLKDALIINDRYIIIPQYMYIKLNLDFVAAFESWYQKVDFEVSLLQNHWGLNRTRTFNMEALVPLNGYLERDLSLSEPVSIRPVNPTPSHKRRLKEIVYRVIYPVGREAFHLIYQSKPKFTLNSLNDSSEKYGGDRLPHYKTTFSVTIEDYILTSYLVTRVRPFDGIVGSFTPPGTFYSPEGRRVLNLLYTFFESLLNHYNIQLDIVSFSEVLGELMEELNIDNFDNLVNLLRTVIFSNDLNSIRELCTTFSNILERTHQVNISNQVVYTFLNNTIMEEHSHPTFSTESRDFPIYTVSTNINLNEAEFFSISSSPDSSHNSASIIVYRVEEGVPANSELRIPPSVWKLTPSTTIVKIPNAYTQVFVDPDTEEIVVKGPLLKGYNLIIVICKG